MKIEVLGMGCPKCRKLYQDVLAAVGELNIHPDIIKVEDIQKIVEHGVMSTPALVIDGKIKAMGSVPDIGKIKEWLSGA